MRQNVILALGLLLVLANGIASGEIPYLWDTIKGLPTPGPLIGPGQKGKFNPLGTTTVPSTNPTTTVPGTTIPVTNAISG